MRAIGTSDDELAGERRARSTSDRYFFLHLMKTGGTTLGSQLWSAFPTSRTYGYGVQTSDFFRSTMLYVNPRPLTALEPAKRAKLRFVAGHFPYAARELIGEPVNVIVLLRHPVDRVVSFLRHAQRVHVEHEGMRLEDIYDDEWYHPRFCDNHEVKMLSMTVDEMLADSPSDGWQEDGVPDRIVDLLSRWRRDPESLSTHEREECEPLVIEQIRTARGFYRVLGAPNTADVAVDDRRLADAVQNLERCEVVGVHEHYDEFASQLSARLGIEIRSDVRRNASERTERVPRSLAARIERDHGPALELYERAHELYRERRG